MKSDWIERHSIIVACRANTSFTWLYKLDDLVRPYVHKILVVIEPLLIDEDYYACVKCRDIISNLSKAAGLAHMISTMRPDIVHADEYVCNTTACAFSVIASALGIPSLLPFLKPVCRSKKSWQAKTSTAAISPMENSTSFSHDCIRHRNSTNWLMESVEVWKFGERWSGGYAYYRYLSWCHILQCSNVRTLSLQYFSYTGGPRAPISSPPFGRKVCWLIISLGRWIELPFFIRSQLWVPKSLWHFSRPNPWASP